MLSLLRVAANARRRPEMPPKHAIFAAGSVGCEFEEVKLVQLGGLEPPTSGSTIRRSNQLSYNCTRGAEIRGPHPQMQAGPKLPARARFSVTLPPRFNPG